MAVVLYHRFYEVVNIETHIHEISTSLTKQGGVNRLNVKKLRTAAGLTQAQLAKKMNVDQSTVSLWEAGKTKPLQKCHKKLAKVLGCTVEELRGD